MADHTTFDTTEAANAEHVSLISDRWTHTDTVESPQGKRRKYEKKRRFKLGVLLFQWALLVLLGILMAKN